MSRIFPYPILSLALLLMWLLLSNSSSPATLLGGAVLATAAPWPLLALEAERLKVARPFALIKLMGIVIFDMTRSNFAVGTIVFGRKRATRTSGFIPIPLEMRNQYGLTLLAMIITCTPGTLWVQYDSTRGQLLIHVLDVIDPADWVALIKGRYERLLMKVFE